MDINKLANDIVKIIPGNYQVSYRDTMRAQIFDLIEQAYSQTVEIESKHPKLDQRLCLKCRVGGNWVKVTDELFNLVCSQCNDILSRITLEDKPAVK